MSKARKKVVITLTVSVPADMSAASARREVRSLINHQANWSADEGDVKAVSVKTVGRKTPKAVSASIADGSPA